MSRNVLSRGAFLVCFLVVAGSSFSRAIAQNAGDDEQSAALNRILEAWHAKSEDIRKLEGKHVRIVYDYVFGVAERANGRFYYEAPDKGRIDLKPDQEGAGEKFEKNHPETGKPVQMKAKADQPERWICDGTQVIVMDDSQKTAEQFPIPEEARGANIMDGPLPFLFGMSPEKARARYQMKLLGDNGEQIDLLIIPKLAKDSANYKWARLRIEKATMLPMAVQMLDPAGTRETVYTFPRIAKNPKPGVFQKLVWWKDDDPFKPDLSDYKIQAARVEKVADKQPPGPGQKPAAVPSVIGFDFKQAKQLLKRAGYEVRLLRGDPAKRQELTYRVQKQSPSPRSGAAKGTTVSLTLFTPPVEQAGAVEAEEEQSEAEQAPAMPPVPQVIGMPWKEAEKLLTGRGYEVKFRQGEVAPSQDKVFQVYKQEPEAGAAARKGTPVTLTLFIRQDMKE